MSTLTAPAPFETHQALKFLLAGNATFTAQSDKTGTRFTYKVKRADPRDGQQEPPRLWFVSLLSGPDNENDFQYLGMIRPPRENQDGPLAFEHGIKSRIACTAPSFIAANWVISHLLRNRPTPSCSVYHEGRCGRCGRKLTVPESIVSGFGPECIQHV